MALFMSECEELGAAQGATNEADARDKAARRVAPQLAQASSSALTDVPHRSAASSSPGLE